MLIDWFTVIAQMVNFLILVWLLKRFLYKPVLLAIDTREKSIAAQILQAAATQAAAQKTQDELTKETVKLDKRKSHILASAQKDADQQRQTLMDQAHKDSDALRAQQSESLDNERIEASREIVRLTCEEVFSVARKTLKDLSNASLESKMADVLVERIAALSADDKAHFHESLQDDSQSVVVQSTFDLPKTEQNAISSAVKKAFTSDRSIEFKTAPDLICGIELLSKSYKVSWSIMDYLNSLEKTVSKAPKAEHAG